MRYSASRPKWTRDAFHGYSEHSEKSGRKTRDPITTCFHSSIDMVAWEPLTNSFPPPRDTLEAPIRWPWATSP